MSHFRTTASSSTPQKRRPPLPVPEASSIASTDTDAGGKYYIQVRDRRHPGHRKVCFVLNQFSLKGCCLKYFCYNICSL